MKDTRGFRVARGEDGTPGPGWARASAAKKPPRSPPKPACDRPLEGRPVRTSFRPAPGLWEPAGVGTRDGGGAAGPFEPHNRAGRSPTPGVAGAAGRRARGAPGPTTKRGPRHAGGLAATYGSGEAPAWRARRCPRPEAAAETSGLKGPGRRGWAPPPPARAPGATSSLRRRQVRARRWRAPGRRSAAGTSRWGRGAGRPFPEWIPQDIPATKSASRIAAPEADSSVGCRARCGVAGGCAEGLGCAGDR